MRYKNMRITLYIPLGGIENDDVVKMKKKIMMNPLKSLQKCVIYRGKNKEDI